MGPSAESFHYSRVSAEWGVLRLLANLGTESREPIGAHLIVQPEPEGPDRYYAHARLPAIERRLLTHHRRRTSQLLWRTAFALPLDVIEIPDALFSVVAFDGFFLTPDRARLTIYEGPEIAAEDRGLGRGWSAVTRDGENVTGQMVEAAGALVPRASGLKQALLATPGPVALSEVPSLVGTAGRPSERLAAAEQAVWELLHEGRVTLTRAGARVAP